MQLFPKVTHNVVEVGAAKAAKGLEVIGDGFHLQGWNRLNRFF